ncbi:MULTISPECIES: crotonase/enoyl-CoA hydratase family protein [unclassified Rhodococcus (in: high G+C Gram-positive bacteria)]|uniref:crotonase/enoyl-CoA hydratase family protein n=1 Tax=unclassified Rhodococcus (in: high G+C Gram-positive bacteria) TaxID=192944 RepID=UPI00163A21BA|nr:MULTISPECIES: crotonase/enoyl-CoA hydratase family protein [unclassified Rhodococcus (in: high G+C Gram-positive bacteria)]MBC2641312.1 crotonase/enoyl-CoA hydratase family protein [Rhodococcus sp. 3A]MBC2893943.1 crotonase/enoyl-CoA hydratase family protein [Rhodococcus sp. 4CII]
MEHIELDVADGIATITLNRPDQLNAFTTTMENELIAAYDRFDADDAVRAIVVTGAGRAFCAGADLTAGADTFGQWQDEQGEDESADARRDGGGRVVLRMFESRKPIIAAINGPAVGVGITMTLAADFRLAADDARIGFVFNRRGIVPESCSTWFLPRLVPLQTALDWVYSGRVFPAAEALDAGLVYKLYPRESLLDEAYALARSLTEHSAPVSVALSRQMMWRALGAEHPMIAHRVETRGINIRGIGPDAKEGISAFLEKRPAVFPDSVRDDLPDVFGDDLPTPAFRG